MRKLLVTISIVLVISHQIQNSIAFDPIGTASSFIGLCQFFFDILQKFYPNDQPFDKTFAATEKFSREVLEDTALIIKYTKNLSKVFRSEIQKQKTEDHFANIQRVFEGTLKLKSKLENEYGGTIEFTYAKFTRKEDEIDKSMSEINRIFSGKGTYALGSNFVGNLKTFEDTCETGMSDFQLLNTLLNNIRIATGQYFWTKKFMNDFLEVSGYLINNTRANLWEAVGDEYTVVANKFLSLMANASTEVWKCDPEGGYDDSIRTKTSPDSNFAEIRAFSRYLLPEYGVTTGIGECGLYPCSQVKKYDECRGLFTQFCQLTHTCPGKLSCYQFKDKAKVCVNTNKQIPYRYHMFVPEEEGNYPSDCSEKDRESWPIQRTKSGGLMHKNDDCYTCNCICEESYEKNGIYHGFFVDNRRIMSNISSNKIVVGARLVVEPFHSANSSLSGQVLRIQISEAISLGNGAVGEGNWKKLPSIREQNLIKIQWDKNRRFYLNPVMVGEDEVITGLAFNRRGAYGPAANDFVLKVFGHKVNFYTGVLDPSSPTKDYRNTKTLTEPFNLTDVDVPTRARMKNELLSSNDQYVDLSLSSDRRDGGQSTVPFIDSQKWEVKTPLAGASLYVRRQRGYGGFLSIKFHTFNTTKYVIRESKFMDLTDAQRLNLTTNFYDMSRIPETLIEKNLKTRVIFSN